MQTFKNMDTRDRWRTYTEVGLPFLPSFCRFATGCLGELMQHHLSEGGSISLQARIGQRISESTIGISADGNAYFRRPPTQRPSMHMRSKNPIGTKNPRVNRNIRKSKPIKFSKIEQSQSNVSKASEPKGNAPSTPQQKYNKNGRYNPDTGASTSNYGQKGNRKPSMDPHNVVQYEKLKSALQVEEITSVIKVTEHGLQRLLGRGFTPQEIIDVINKPTQIKNQMDGARVFIRQISVDRYRYIVVKPDTQEVISAIRNISGKNLNGLGKRYGWR